MIKPETQKEMMEQIWWKLMSSNGPSTKAMTVRRVLEIGVGFLVLVLGLGGLLLLFVGKLTPNDIVRILEAWGGR